MQEDTTPSPLYIPHSQLKALQTLPDRSTALLAFSLLAPNRYTNTYNPSHHILPNRQVKLAPCTRHSPTSPMRRHGSEASPSIVHTSSIALLQERFRNLQKVKEMREGRELQRVHTATDADRTGSLSSALNLGLQAANSLNLGLQAATANSTEQPRWFFHPDLIRPSRPLRAPAFQGLGATAGQTSPRPASLWGGMQNSGYRSDVDVDTSLHL